MKKCYLDANFLLSYQDTRSVFHAAAIELVQKLIDGRFKLFTSSLALDEYIHNTIRFSGKSLKLLKPDLSVSLREIFSLPDLELINPTLELKKHLEILELMEEYGLRARDAYHIFLILENGIGYLATFDSDFKKVFASGKVKKFIS